MPSRRIVVYPQGGGSIAPAPPVYDPATDIVRRRHSLRVFQQPGLTVSRAMRNALSTSSSGPPPSTLFNFNPGHGIGAAIVGSSDVNSAKAVYDLARFDPIFVNGHCVFTWIKLNPSPGVFTLTDIITLRDYLIAMGKTFSIEIWKEKFGVTVSNPFSGSHPFPQWIIDLGESSDDNSFIGGWYFVNKDLANNRADAVEADMRNPTVRAAFIELYHQVLLLIGGDPNIIALCFTETAGLTRGASQYDLLAGAVPYRTKVPLYVMHNFFGLPNNYTTQFNAQPPSATGPNDAGLIDYIASVKAGAGGVDVLPFPQLGYTSDGQLAFSGAGNFNNGSGVTNYGPNDRRGVLGNLLQRQYIFVADCNIVAAWAQSMKCTNLMWWIDGTVAGGDYASAKAAALSHPLWTTYPTGW